MTRPAFTVFDSSGESVLEIDYDEEGYARFTVIEMKRGGVTVRASVFLDQASTDEVFVELGTDFEQHTEDEAADA